jgi:hypothetical protein
MQRLPLSIPSRNAPDTPLVRLSRAIGTHPYAVALATCGWKVSADALVGDFGDEMTWWVEDRLTEAQSICRGWEQGVEYSSDYTRFAACMAALTARAAVQQWVQTGTAPLYWQQRGRFLEPATSASFIEPPPARFSIRNIDAAAALIACGFVPLPTLINGIDGSPLVGLPEYSTTFRGLRITDCLDALHRPADSIVTPVMLPDYPPEEHPFLYALQALLNLPGFAAVQQAAAQSPRVALRSRYSQRSAIVPADAIREGRRDTAAFRDRLRTHLSA